MIKQMNILREAERQAFCRLCNAPIEKGDMMVSWYSYRNRGMYVHLHPNCVIDLGESVKEAIKEDNDKS